MSNINKEQLRERAREKVKSLEFAVTQAAFAYSRAELEEELELARIAMASLEAEPVCYLTWHQGFRAPDDCEEYVVEAKPGDKSCDGSPAFPVYAAPPAPVSVPDAATAIRACMEEFPESVHDIVEECAAIAENACRPAMLQGAEPVTTAYKLPDNFDFDRFNDVVWLEAVASNPHMHSLTTSTIAMVTLELNKRLGAGNSPVIPDGWTGSDEANAALIMLDRIETVDSVDDDRIEGIKRIIRALAAAPQQE